jgi:hypothetical protein
MFNQLKRRPSNPAVVQSLHTAIDNNIDAIRKMLT